MTDKGLILIVDDVPQNLKVLRSTLKPVGYRVAAANKAQMALQFLEKQTPELILLDVMMPEVNGFELCRQIKQQPTLQDIPVIFLTARTEKESLLAGFEAGGVDYITKPFETMELLSRVKVHVELKQARDAVAAYNRKLQALNQEKTEFMGIASHDLKNPLTAILMHAQTLLQQQALPEDIKESGQVILHSGRHMHDIICNLLDLNRLESEHLEPRLELWDLQDLLTEAVKSIRSQAHNKQISLTQLPCDELCLVETDWQLFIQILNNLLSNAVKFSQPGTAVAVGIEAQSQSVTCWIQDQGPGFTAADRQRMYQKFARLSARPTGEEQSTGLGLSIVAKLAELLQVELSYDSQPGEGTRFRLCLPRIAEIALDELGFPLTTA